MELKTLQDTKSAKNQYGEKCWYEEDLRQEAIKWIKIRDIDNDRFLNELFDNPLKFSCMGDEVDKSRETISGMNKNDFSYFITIWIKYFFNITEEDLK